VDRPLNIDRRSATEDFCREIEIYLCRKNDGHLIRVVGPSFDLVSGWAERGVPLKVAYTGIDRYFERYYRKGPRRRPVKIDFCEADVLDVFDEWRQATGAVIQSSVDSLQSSVGSVQPSAGSRQSLPAHLERVVVRLTAARASGLLGETFDALIDRVAAELDAARAKAGGVRGSARQALVERLSTLDAELRQQARAGLDQSVRTSMEREALEELEGFRSGMTAEAFARARDAVVDRLVRTHLGLPTIAFR
jgi:hypothetical protein